ncbi:hypothetical protein LAWI1_G005264 [Lachnellula willkommii]|uniref:Uncharacterized protein n=1 Tax=Lachnellula willkommii TaxID=215461 RepID=A0A559M845_9HELO|nr:hypothetical protein LAWI1_G005264 [Lachnellula willkommii]
MHSLHFISRASRCRLTTFSTVTSPALPSTRTRPSHDLGLTSLTRKKLSSMRKGWKRLCSLPRPKSDRQRTLTANVAPSISKWEI